MNFDEFLRRMAADGAELAPWQQQLAKSLFDGEQPTIAPARRKPGKWQANVLACAIAEIQGVRWDVVGLTPEDEQSIRREARELAARLTDG